MELKTIVSAGRECGAPAPEKFFLFFPFFLFLFSLFFLLCFILFFSFKYIKYIIYINILIYIFKTNVLFKREYILGLRSEFLILRSKPLLLGNNALVLGSKRQAQIVFIRVKLLRFWKQNALISNDITRLLLISSAYDGLRQVTVFHRNPR